MPTEQSILRRILELHEDGNGAMRIANALNEQHMKTPRVRRRWNRGTIASIVQTAIANPRLRFGKRIGRYRL